MTAFGTLQYDLTACPSDGRVLMRSPLLALRRVCRKPTFLARGHLTKSLLMSLVSYICSIISIPITSFVLNLWIIVRPLTIKQTLFFRSTGTFPIAIKVRDIIIIRFYPRLYYTNNAPCIWLDYVLENDIFIFLI